MLTEKPFVGLIDQKEHSSPTEIMVGIFLEQHTVATKLARRAIIPGHSKKSYGHGHEDDLIHGSVWQFTESIKQGRLLRFTHTPDQTILYDGRTYNDEVSYSQIMMKSTDSFQIMRSISIKDGAFAHYLYSSTNNNQLHLEAICRSGSTDESKPQQLNEPLHNVVTTVDWNQNVQLFNNDCGQIAIK